MDSNIDILCTAPIPKSLIDKAAAHGIDIAVVPFIKTEAVNDDALQEQIISLHQQTIQAVFTSVNAVEALAYYQFNADWKIFCIGNATAKAVEKKYGSSVIIGMADNAAALADIIIHKNNGNKIVFFCGDIHRNELPEELKQSGIAVDEVIVYKTTETPRQINKPFDGILFFSPSAVSSFFSVNAIADNTILFAIGNTTADALKKVSANKIIISDTPAKEQVINNVIGYYNNVTASTKLI